MIKQLSNSVIAKYCDLSMSRRSIICLSLRLRQIIDLLATDKSQYFAQPRPIIVNYLQIEPESVPVLENFQENVELPAVAIREDAHPVGRTASASFFAPAGFWPRGQNPRRH